MFFSFTHFTQGFLEDEENPFRKWPDIQGRHVFHIDNSPLNQQAGVHPHKSTGLDSNVIIPMSDQIIIFHGPRFP